MIPISIWSIDDDDDLCTVQMMMMIPFLITKSSDHIVKIIFLEKHGNGHSLVSSSCVMMQKSIWSIDDDDWWFQCILSIMDNKQIGKRKIFDITLFSSLRIIYWTWIWFFLEILRELLIFCVVLSWYIFRSRREIWKVSQLEP